MMALKVFFLIAIYSQLKGIQAICTEKNLTNVVLLPILTVKHTGDWF